MPNDHESLHDVPGNEPDVDVGRVRAILLLGGVPFDDLDDAVQQVRLKLVESLGTPGNPGGVRNVEGWAAVVASRVAVDWHRTRTRDRGLRERLVARFERTSTGLSEDDRILTLSVADGLQALTPVQREVLVLRYYVDLPVSEIAEHLGVADGTVKSRLNSAVAALRTRLRDEEVI